MASSLGAPSPTGTTARRWPVRSLAGLRHATKNATAGGIQSHPRESNPRPTDYETVQRTTERADLLVLSRRSAGLGGTRFQPVSVVTGRLLGSTATSTATNSAGVTRSLWPTPAISAAGRDRGEP